MKKIKKHGALKIYLKSRWLYLHNMEFLAKFFYKLNIVIYQCSLDYRADISPNVRLCHARGVFVRPYTVIEDGTVIFQQVIFGTKYPDVDTKIHVGKNCLIGANACILGDVTIGDDVTIGAGAIVLEDVPNNSLVVGPKATVFPRE